MKMNLMRNIDTWLGWPVAKLWATFRRSSPSLGGTAIPQATQKILVIKILGMGSCILSLPLLNTLRQQKHKVHYLTLKSNAYLIEKSQLAEHVHFIDTKNLGTLFLSTFKVIQQIRKFSPDTIVDLEPTSFLTAILSQFLNAKYRLGFLVGKPARENLYSHLISYKAQTHFANQALDFARLTGSIKNAEVSLPASPFSSKKNAQGFKIVFNMTSSDLAPQRLWRGHSWVLLAKEILKNPHAEISFTGLQEDFRAIEDLVREVGTTRAHNLAGKTNIEQLISLLSEARLLVTVDSGVMHLAAWLGLPQVALFGPESPEAFGPISERAKVIYSQRACSPCLTVQTNKKSQCQDNLCLKEISAEQVLWTCRQHIEKYYAPKSNKKAA